MKKLKKVNEYIRQSVKPQCEIVDRPLKEEWDHKIAAICQMEGKCPFCTHAWDGKNPYNLVRHIMAKHEKTHPFRKSLNVKIKVYTLF